MFNGLLLSAFELLTSNVLKAFATPVSFEPTERKPPCNPSNFVMRVLPFMLICELADVPFIRYSFVSTFSVSI